MAAAVRTTLAPRHLTDVIQQNELQIDRLVTLCSILILRYLNVNNACYVLAEATHFNAATLIERIQGYIAVNMETFLESRMFDDTPAHLVEQLAEFVFRKQTEKSPVQRSEQLIEKAMKNQRDWLALQDIPEPIARTSKVGLHKHSPKLSPSSPSKGPHRQPTITVSPFPSPMINAQFAPYSHPSSGDDIFAMDEPDALPPLSLGQDLTPIPEVEKGLKPLNVWNPGRSAPRCVAGVLFLIWVLTYQQGRHENSHG